MKKFAGSNAQYHRPEEEIKTDEGFASRKDPEKVGYVPEDQIVDPDREYDFDIDRKNDEYKKYASIAASELVDAFIEQQDYDMLNYYLKKHPELKEYVQNNYPHYFDTKELKEKEDVLGYYRKHYPQYFIEEVSNSIDENPRGELELMDDKDTISGRKHSDEKKGIMASASYSNSRKTIKTAPKGTPKKDRRHKYSKITGDTYRKKEVNTEQRRDAKDDLKKIIKG